MNKMKKKTPKSSSKRRKNKKERRERIIVLGIFLAFIIVVIYLYYFFEMPSFKEDVVAIVNGNEITREKLDWWYKISVLSEDRDIITKQDFLVLSLIPQEILMQEAKKEDIKATSEDVEELVGIFIIENGLSLEEFEMNLESRGLTIEDVKKSFETRATIIKLLEKENISFADGVSQEEDDAFQLYVHDLMNSSDIEIFPENIDKLILRSFEMTDDEICKMEEKPIVRMYTTSFCDVCNESVELFQDSVVNFVIDESVQAQHWSLDTGDNLLTIKKEEAVPKEEYELFKKYSPNSLVPTVVIGCKYKHVGKFGIEERDEFEAIIKDLVGS
jgi:hypothetical protein